jgi:hypothetical protein
VIQHFEELTPSPNDAGERTTAGQALAVVLSEIDENARATFSSITLATMLRLIERQHEHDEPRTRRAAD